MDSQAEPLKVAQEGRVLTVTFDNPPMNAITPDHQSRLADILYRANADADCAAMVITGAGDRAFSAGGDVHAMAARLRAGDHGAWRKAGDSNRRMINALLRFEKPLIARVNGHAVGLGATIALLADFTVMVTGKRLADAHVNIGLSAGDGGALIWPFIAGFQQAKKYLLTGDHMTAETALDLGMIAGVAADLDDLDQQVTALLAPLTSGASRAIGLTKSSINNVLCNLLDGLIDAHLGIGYAAYLSQDHFEAVHAFAEKRAPVYEGC